jgi:hypothetical protein
LIALFFEVTPRPGQDDRYLEIAGALRPVFEDYRLRVGAVLAEGMPGQPVAEHAAGVSYNDPERVPERWMVVVRSEGAPVDGARGGESFRSVYDDSRYAFVATVRDRAEGHELIARAIADSRVHVAQLCLVSRDYGLLDRTEAPQYFRPVR